MARYNPAAPPILEAFLGDDDGDGHYDRVAAQMQLGAQTPPTPTTPSEAVTPRSLGGQASPLTPRSEDEPSRIATPPSEDEPADISYRDSDTSTSPSRTGKAQHEYITSPPRTGRTRTAGTMIPATVDIDALITPGSMRASTRWASQADYDDMHELGDLAGESAVLAVARSQTMLLSRLMACVMFARRSY